MTEMEQPVSEPHGALRGQDKMDAHLAGNAVLAKTSLACQVCFELFPSEELVRKICGKTCPAVVCHSCLEEYMNTKLNDQIRGVPSKLTCPVCIQPVNLVRWKRRAPFVYMESILDNFSYHVEAACEILCPECHEVSTVLPDAQDRVYSIAMTRSYKSHVPALRAKCAAFCQHRISAAELVDYIIEVFDDYCDLVLESVVPLIHDTERRVTLVLYILHQDPFTFTACCDAAVCFRCKVAGHHEDQDCSAMFPNVDDVAQCPECNVFLVKGDGCNSMTCVCGACFEWDEEVVRYRMQSMTARHIAAFKRVSRFLQVRVWRSRYDLVLDELPFGFIDLKLRVGRTSAAFRQLWQRFKRVSPAPAPIATICHHLLRDQPTTGPSSKPDKALWA
ncbi:hypothetical protein ACHHYP_14248 [Achlya hypogyna]|uniref:RING-type domain-containing protein n=1 Tax=Achlya hypogyna TaxID=1202772 RepID=A0A1V9YDJ3_ACHHY|nr:hypothetical protein ACHHYP_14248 [Achlya hypogyna]